MCSGLPTAVRGPVVQNTLLPSEALSFLVSACENRPSLQGWAQWAGSEATPGRMGAFFPGVPAASAQLSTLNTVLCTKGNSILTPPHPHEDGGTLRTVARLWHLPSEPSAMLAHGELSVCGCEGLAIALGQVERGCLPALGSGNLLSLLKC